jgi:lambda repressor-like predicted transcriptional regulator
MREMCDQTRNRLRPTDAQVANAMRIRGELLALGVKIADVASALKVTGAAVSHTLRGGGSARIRKHIARLLGRRVREVWPGRNWRRRRTAEQIRLEAKRGGKRK